MSPNRCAAPPVSTRWTHQLAEQIAAEAAYEADPTPENLARAERETQEVVAAAETAEQETLEATAAAAIAARAVLSPWSTAG